MYFDLFGHRDYNMMQPFFMVDPVLKQPLRGSRRPRSYIQCIQDSNRPLSSLLTPVGWTRPNISLARNEMARQISGLAIPVSINPFKDICGYFQCAPFPRLQTGKVVWVLSFDP